MNYSIMPLDEVYEGLINNAPDEDIDYFNKIVNKICRLLHTNQNKLTVVYFADEWDLDTSTLDLSPLDAKKNIYKVNDNVVLEKINGSLFFYCKDANTAEDFVKDIDHDDESLDEELLDESTKEEIVHDFMSARRLAKKYGGRITGPITNENGLKVYKVRYTENLKEDVNEDDYWERQRDKYWDSKDYDYPDYDALIRDNEKELFKELVLSDLTTTEHIIDFINWYDQDDPDKEYMSNIKDYSYDQLVEEIVKWYNDFDALVDYLDEDKYEIAKWYANDHDLVVNQEG